MDIRDIANLELIADKILKVVSDLRMLCENLHRAQEIFPAAARRAEEIETFFQSTILVLISTKFSLTPMSEMLPSGSMRSII